MREGDLAELLKEHYRRAAAKDVALTIHLFGIEFAKELQGKSIKQICVGAEIPLSYGTEIRKGIRLAEHVELKK